MYCTEYAADCYVDYCDGISVGCGLRDCIRALMFIFGAMCYIAVYAVSLVYIFYADRGFALFCCAFGTLGVLLSAIIMIAAVLDINGQHKKYMLWAALAVYSALSMLYFIVMNIVASISRPQEKTILMLLGLIHIVPLVIGIFRAITGYLKHNIISAATSVVSIFGI